VVLQQLKLLYTRAGTFFKVPFIIEIVVLQQLKLLYTRAGNLLYGFLEG